MDKIKSLLAAVEACLESFESQDDLDFASKCFVAHLRAERDELRGQLDKPQIIEWEDGLDEEKEEHS